MKIGINGFGRIGRNLARVIFEENKDNIEIEWICDLMRKETCVHLLKYDSIQGRFPFEITEENDHIVIKGKKIKFYRSINDASQSVDVLMDCSGHFNINDTIGFKKIIVSAPFNDADITVVFGVNHKDIKKEHRIISNASCTTNCLAPIAKCLEDTFGIEYGHMTTIHSYTNDQKLIDSAHKDLRRARAAAISMIPSSTGAATAVGLVIPSLKGKLAGTAIRVPTPNVSVVDLTCVLKKETTVGEVNNLLIDASKTYLNGILAVESAPLVSCDFLKNPNSSIVDLMETTVVKGKLCRILSWYDNEWGFTNRMIDLILN